MKRTPAVLAALVAAMLTVGCVRVRQLSYPAPPPTSTTVAAVTTTAALPDLAGLRLAGVDSRTTTTVAMGPGAATLTGTVVGPAGPVGGADVHVERLVGDGAAAVDVTARADGTWSLPGVLGGRYRVRAWRAPDLAETDPQVFFLAGTATWSATLRLEQFGQAVVTPVVDPDPPVVGRPAALTVQLVTRVVDGTGVVRPRPVAGAPVALSAGGAWTFTGPAATVTGPSGAASWQLVCDQAGPQLLAVTVNGTDAYPVEVAGCIAPPPPPTTTGTTTTVPTTSAPGPTTTTVTAGTLPPPVTATSTGH